MIYHPQSPFKGQHYPYPVELIDVFPTINDILKAKFDDTQICKSAKCLPLSGKSLAKVVLGETLLNQTLNHKASKTGAVTNDNNALPVLDQKFAISQTLRCAPKNQLEMVAVEQQDSSSGTSLHKKTVRKSIWVDCDKFKKDNSMLSVLGYSMRTPDYRYTAYFHYNLITNVVDVVKPPYAQELYNHKNETLKDFRHRETVNLYGKPIYDTLAKNLLHSLVQLIKTIPFHDQKK